MANEINKIALSKRLEWWWRELRSYLSPSNHSCYRELLSKYLNKPTDSQKLVLFDLNDIRIDNVGGRYFYHIVHDFIAAGFTPFYRKRFRFLANIQSKGYKKHLLGFPVHIYNDESEILKKQADSNGKIEIILISDSAKIIAESKLSQKIRINYERRRAIPDKNEVPLNFSMSPAILRKKPLIPKTDPDQKRPIKFLFAGNLDPKVYGSEMIQERYALMNRIQIIDTVKKHLDTKLGAEEEKSKTLKPNLFCPQEQLSFEEMTQKRNFVILDTRKCKTPNEKWLELLSKADFFIATPGKGMPLCHNIVEAMAVGTIPILNYNDYLPKGLKDKENCYVFEDANSLIEILRSKDLLDPRLRNKLSEYYKSTLQPGVLVKDLIKASHKCDAQILINDYRIKRKNK